MVGQFPIECDKISLFVCRHAAALVHVPVQPGGVRGGRLPALARGRHRRLPRQGRGAVPGECVRVATIHFNHLGATLVFFNHLGVHYDYKRPSEPAWRLERRESDV